MFEKLFNQSGFEHFDSVSKKYRGLLCYINLNTDRSPDLKAMKYTINAFEVYIEKYPEMTPKAVKLLKVISTRAANSEGLKMHFFRCFTTGTFWTKKRSSTGANRSHPKSLSAKNSRRRWKATAPPWSTGSKPPKKNRPKRKRSVCPQKIFSSSKRFFPRQKDFFLGQKVFLMDFF